MKTKILIHAVMLLLLAGSFSSCTKGEESEKEDFFYYYFGEKTFLKQVEDKICIRFAPDAGKEQLLALIDSYSSLKPVPSFTFLDYSDSRFAVLETQGGSHISLATIESFKTREEVVSVEYMYLYDNRVLIGLNDKITVKLKETATYAQLQNLAEQNHCIIGKEDLYNKNQFTLYVSKTSKLNALQIANLFYETGIFEWSSPYFFSLVTAD